MKTIIKWAFYLGALQAVFIVCGPHWVVGGLVASMVVNNLKP